jgi:hypothetical protein
VKYRVPEISLVAENVNSDVGRTESIAGGRDGGGDARVPAMSSPSNVRGGPPALHARFNPPHHITSRTPDRKHPTAERYLPKCRVDIIMAVTPAIRTKPRGDVRKKPAVLRKRKLAMLDAAFVGTKLRRSYLLRRKGRILSYMETPSIPTGFSTDPRNGRGALRCPTVKETHARTKIP